MSQSQPLLYLFRPGPVHLVSEAVILSSHKIRFFSRSFINGFLERTEHNGQPVEPGWESRLDLESNDVVIKGSNTTRVSKKQVRLITTMFFKVLAKANPSGGCRARYFTIHAAMGERLHASSA